MNFDRSPIAQLIAQPPNLTAGGGYLLAPHHRSHIGTQILQGQLDLLPLRFSSFRAYASSIALPRYLQGSIPGPWLAVTGTGLAPARTNTALPSRNIEMTPVRREAPHALRTQPLVIHPQKP